MGYKPSLDKQTHDRVEHIFKFLEYDKLTDWEDNFVVSVSGQFERSGFLSKKQLEILERIFKQSEERDFEGYASFE